MDLAIIALAVVADWNAVWLAFIVVGVAVYIAILRLGGPFDSQHENYVSNDKLPLVVQSAITALGIAWFVVLFVFADWWWRLGFIY